MSALPFPAAAVPRAVHAVQHRHLLALLHPYRAFFRGRGVDVPDPGAGGPVPIDPLVDVLLDPAADLPAGVVGALAGVVGVGTPDALPAVLAAARDAGVSLSPGDDLSPADLAVRLWLHAPVLLARTLAEHAAAAAVPFAYFRAVGFRPPHRGVTEDVVAAVERDLAGWFGENLLGPAVRVRHAHRHGGAWFLVRRGEPVRREEGLLGATPADIAYRPLAYDTVVFDPRRDELRAHAARPDVADAYRRVLGRHLFGRDDVFAPAPKYTLRPLRDDGEGALRCADVVGLEGVTLREVHYRWGGAHPEWDVVRSDDVFAALRDRGCGGLPAAPDLVRATFELTFRGDVRPQLVTIAPPNTALYDRDQDVPRVEEWLSNRGFLDATDGDRATAPLLASA